MGNDIEVEEFKLISVTATAPDQASPEHILNALNNDCIQEVFRRLKNIEDFLSAAEVCTQFQENARRCFPPAYKEFCSTHARYYRCQYYYECETKADLLLPLNRVKSFVSIFSDLIEKIEWEHHDEVSTTKRRICLKRKEDIEYDTKNFLVLADHCQNNLKDFRIRRRLIDFNLLQKFQALEKLIIDRSVCLHTEAFNSGLFSKLKYIKISSSFGLNGDWMQQTFPNLIEAIFEDVFFLNQSILVEFIKRNLQLERLFVCMIHIDSSFWNAFEDTPKSNLQYLKIGNRFCIYNEDDIKTFPKCFSNLKYFHIGVPRELNAQNIFIHFINLLSENNVPIENLSLFEYRLTSLPGNIHKLNHMKALKIGIISKGTLLNVCKQLPSLTSLTVEMNEDTEIIEIFEALKYAKNLVSLSVRFSIGLNHVESLQNFYYTLLNLVKGRVKVELYFNIFSSSYHIPIDQSVLKMNEDWLKIKTYPS